MNHKLRLAFFFILVLCTAGAAHYFFFGQYRYVNSIALINPKAYAQMFLAAERHKDAEDYVEFYRSLPGVSSDEAARLEPILYEARQKRSSLSYKASQTLKGFLLGSSDEDYGKAAELASIIVGVSDVRDLITAGRSWVADEEVDAVTTTLAAAGLALTAVSVGPQAPLVQSAKVGMGIVKVAARAGKISKPLRQSLKTTVAKLFTKGSAQAAFEELARPMAQLSAYAARSDLGNAFEVVGRSRSLDEMPRVIKAAEQFGDKAGAVLRFGGRDVVAATQRRGAQEVLAVSKYGDNAVSALKNVSARKLLHDIKRWSAIAASSLLRALDVVLWIVEAVLSILAGAMSLAGVRMLRKARRQARNGLRGEQ